MRRSTPSRPNLSATSDPTPRQHQVCFSVPSTSSTRCSLRLPFSYSPERSAATSSPTCPLFPISCRARVPCSCDHVRSEQLDPVVPGFPAVGFLHLPDDDRQVLVA